jgi:3-oxoacyl-[acyl-carrier protein] reductase
MDLKLDGRAALVTGSSRGIGRATARALALEGCRVAVTSRGGPDLDAAVAEIRAAAGRDDAALPFAGDLTTAEGVAAVTSAALAALGPIEILVNNLGGSGARHFHDADERDLAAILDRNLWPAFRVSKALLPAMRARGGGAIVHVTSVWGREAGGSPSYNVAKSAEISLAKAMARDLAADHIRVNSVAPGSILFPGGGWDRRQKADPEGIAAFVQRELPWGRFGTPDEVADVVAFLCSPRAAWITGASVAIDGAQGRAF